VDNALDIATLGSDANDLVRRL